MTDEIVKLPIKFKSPLSDEKMLRTVNFDRKCDHRGTFLIDESLEHVECAICKERLSPMFVLRMLAVEETKWHEAKKRYSDEMRRLSERQRTKCRHCGQMTTISRN